MSDEHEQAEVEGQLRRANEDADATSDDVAEVEGQVKRPLADGTSDEDTEVEGQILRPRSVEDQSARR